MSRAEEAPRRGADAFGDREDAREERGNEEGRRRARSKKVSDWAVRVTERGGSPASNRRRGMGEVKVQPVIARHAERWVASRC